jgi:hypothetical protein
VSSRMEGRGLRDELGQAPLSSKFSPTDHPGREGGREGGVTPRDCSSTYITCPHILAYLRLRRARGGKDEKEGDSGGVAKTRHVFSVVVAWVARDCVCVCRLGRGREGER